MFCKYLLVYINSKVPFHENLPPLPSHRSGVPACTHVTVLTFYLADHLINMCIDSSSGNLYSRISKKMQKMSGWRFSFNFSLGLKHLAGN